MNERATAENNHKLDLMKIKADLEVKELQAENSRKELKQEFDLKKEKVADPRSLQRLKLETVKDIHAVASFSGVYLNTSDNKEPIYGLVDKFISMTASK